MPRLGAHLGGVAHQRIEDVPGNPDASPRSQDTAPDLTCHHARPGVVVGKRAVVGAGANGGLRAVVDDRRVLQVVSDDWLRTGHVLGTSCLTSKCYRNSYSLTHVKPYPNAIR